MSVSSTTLGTSRPDGVLGMYLSSREDAMSRAIDPSELSRYAPGNLGLDWLGQQLARHRANGSKKPGEEAKPAATARGPQDQPSTVRQMMLEITNSGLDVVERPERNGPRRG